MQIESSILDLERCRQIFNPTAKTWKFLQENTYLIPDLLQWYQLEPFPKHFVAQEIEIVYDGITFIKANAQETYLLKYPDPEELKDYLPEYSEYFFDGEIGVFHCRGEILIDRTQNLAEIHFPLLIPKFSDNS